jgi:hypothetical protein
MPVVTGDLLRAVLTIPQASNAFQAVMSHAFFQDHLLLVGCMFEVKFLWIFSRTMFELNFAYIRLCGRFVGKKSCKFVSVVLPISLFLSRLRAVWLE